MAWRPDFTVGLREVGAVEGGGVQYCAVRRYLLVLAESPPASPDDVLQTFDRDTCFPSGRMVMRVAADGSVSVAADELADRGPAPRQVALAIAAAAALIAVVLRVRRRPAAHRRDVDVT